MTVGPHVADHDHRLWTKISDHRTGSDFGCDFVEDYGFLSEIVVGDYCDLDLGRGYGFDCVFCPNDPSLSQS